MSAVVPPLLSPYVSPGPQGSLTLVTSVLDATSNWLLLRYVHAALTVQELADKQSSLHGNVDQEHQESFKVVFVSILRDFEQWREMGKRVVCKLRLF
jgi:elongator complex protein 6